MIEVEATQGRLNDTREGSLALGWQQQSDFAVLVPYEIDCSEAGDIAMVGAPDLLHSLHTTHERTMDAMRRLATIMIVHSSDPAEHEGVVNLAARTRTYKSYAGTAGHIAGTLAQDGFEHVLVTDDVALLRQIGDPGRPNPDFVWLNTAGVQGRDPMVQTAALMEAAGVPYIGHRPMAYGMADNKVVADAVLQSGGVAVPHSIDLSNRNDASVAELSRNLLLGMPDDGPYRIAKPINGRGSVGVERLDLREFSVQGLARKLGALSSQYSGIKLDEYLPGREVTVSVMQVGDRTVVFPPLLRQIDPVSGIFASLDKQAVADRVEILDPHDPDFVQIASETQQAYGVLGLEGLARIDLRANAQGRFAVIDVNPKPDLGTVDGRSMTEVAAGACELDFGQLLELLLLARIDQGFASHPAFENALTLA